MTNAMTSIRSTLVILLSLTALGFGGNAAALIIDLSLDCEGTTCQYVGEAEISGDGSALEIQGIFENMQHVETLTGAEAIEPSLQFIAIEPSSGALDGVVFLSNELGESVFVLSENFMGDFSLIQTGFSRRFGAGDAFLEPGLFIHDIHWPLVEFSGSATVKLSGEFLNVQAGVWGEAVPEPTTLALLSLGLAGLGFTRRKMKA